MWKSSPRTRRTKTTKTRKPCCTGFPDRKPSSGQIPGGGFVFREQLFISKPAQSAKLTTMHILVVEDEKKTAAFIRKALLAEGFAVDVVHNGDEVAHLVSATSFDAIVMDIMLPKRDGISALRQLRTRKITTPVLLLSARGGVDERVEGLNAGADDYLPKPFVLAELIARIRALGRRSVAHLPVELRLANLLLNTATRIALRDSTEIELTSREYLLLEYLMRSAGRICSRMAILEQVWGYTFDPGTNIVDVYIKRVREKIDAGFTPRLLHSVRGVGYVMKIES